MVTSLTSALFLHWTTPSPSTPTKELSNSELSLLHNLAQYVHSLAQGKVGSGFDVSAAVWGSQIYRRFAVGCLGDLLSRPEGAERVTSRELLEVLSPERNPAWSDEAMKAIVLPFALPPGTILILADVDAGSNTPSMVSKVLAWKKRAPQQADESWNALKDSNLKLAENFKVLTRLAKRGNVELMGEDAELDRRTKDEWETAPHFLAATQHIETTRRLMREMGELSDVPIEPPEQTRLLDACSSLFDVIGAGVPGAGGYDAVWVLVKTAVADSTGPTPAEEVEKLLLGWKEMSVRPLSRDAWVHGGQEEGKSGLLLERLELVDGLKAAVDRV
ncbi:phosphomevalonate kinase, partial [Phenoliferia sp. Uapishka_3]